MLEAFLKFDQPQNLKVLKDYIVISLELYRHHLEGVLTKCVREKDASKKLEEVHEATCEQKNLACSSQRIKRRGGIMGPR